MMAERFAGMNVGNMDFDNGDFYAPNRVTNCHTRMRQSTRVEDNARVGLVETNFVELVNQYAFVVRLHILDLY